MALNEYRKRRRFGISPEPPGDAHPQESRRVAGIYVIQKHRASHLHYDFRLESNGTLLSWAVPKGPSLDPAVKRLAMQVEDHPIEYADFEGVIPEGEYGGGTVMVWDKGTWSPDQGKVAASLQKGELKFTLHGEKLKGSWVLVRTRLFGRSSRRPWLLIKHRDQFASANKDVTEEKPRSATSNRLLAEIARDDGGDAAEAATGDPIHTAKRKIETKPAGKRFFKASRLRAAERSGVKTQKRRRKPV
jgi:bifunctional non-homologous end joining protein LigD